MADSDNDTTIGLPAGEVIARFGGIRPMATKMGISFSTVQGWKERNHIPAQRHAEIAALAKQHGVSLEPSTGPSSAPSSAPPAETRPEAKPETAHTQAPPFRQATAAPAAASGAERAQDRPPPMPPPLAPRAAAPEPKKGLGIAGAALVSIVIVAAAFAGAYVARDQWLGAPPPFPAPRQPSVDKAALDALGARVAKMEKGLADRPAPAPGAAGSDAKLAADVAALDKRIGDLQSALYAARDQAKRDGQATAATLAEVTKAAKAGAGEQQKATAALSARVEALEKGFDPAAFIAIRNSLNDLSARLDALAKRTAAVERMASAARAEGMARASLALSVGQLRRAVDAGAPFSAELAACRALAGGDAAVTGPLDQLAPLAGKGAPTRAALTDSFAKTAALIVHAGRQREGQASAWRRFLAWLDSLVTVRRVGGSVAGGGPAALAARAEARLAAGDLSGAIDALAALTGPAAAAAKPWLDGAKARRGAESALAALESRAAELARK